MMERDLQQTLALAGLAQAAFLVHQLGTHGLAARDKLNTMVDSLFVTHPKTAEEVFGRVDRLNLGLQILQELLDGGARVLAPSDVLRYVASLLYLEYRLQSRPRMLAAIGSGLESIRGRFPEGEPGENMAVLTELSRLYQATLSTLPFRIQVRGDMNQLKNEQVACKVRVVLFAGVRAAVLWRQVGGRRWHLLLRRRRIARSVTLLQHHPGVP